MTAQCASSIPAYYSGHPDCQQSKMLRLQLCRWQAVRERVHCRGGRLHPHRHWQSAVLRQMTYL